VLSATALTIIGVDYAIVIGVISGICNMIPYVGPLVGTVLAATMGLLSGRPIMILWAIIAMLIVQQIDNNLIAPKIVGDSVGLHPVFTMLVILIGGNVGGLVGMLIAVPLTASAKILISRWYDANVDYKK
jgi:predicted PurR-regulated permease PerM